MRFVITFPVGGPLHDRYTEVVAHDELSARLAIKAVYGTRGWSGIYPADATAQRMVVQHGLHPIDLGYGREVAESYKS